MPVIHVAAAAQPAPIDLDTVVTRLTLIAADAFECEPSHVWVTWRTLDVYAEGADLAREQKKATHHPVAEILAFTGRDEETIRRVLTVVADALVELLGLEPGAAFVHYTELQPGRVYTGGEVRF